MNAILERRSVRKYLDRPVEPEKLDQLLRAAMQSPSAGNMRPWEFLVIQDRESLLKLSKMSTYATPAETAPLAIVLLGNKKRMRPEVDYFPQDMGAASENMLLEAVDLGLGAVWLGVYPLEDRVRFLRELFSIPEHLEPFNVIVAGYPAEENANHFIDRYNAWRVHYEKI